MRRLCSWLPPRLSLFLLVGFAFSLGLAISGVGGRSTASAQKKAKTPVASDGELTKLREEFISATRDYKNSLEKLLAIYEGNVRKAEEKLAVSRKLYEEGLIARQQLEGHERAVAGEKDKVAEARRQMENADTQIANVLVEARADEQIAKNLRLAKRGFVSTTAAIRYNGADGWGLSDAWKIERFFSDKFSKPLPVAVFGQGSIHDRWRLDHRNAIDVSLYPDSVEGQALLDFLRKSGIPFSAFREAIPGTATGPHIHIGRPSHRY